MSPGVGDSGSDIDAVLDILSRPDDDDLADVVELVAKICDAAAAGITVLKGDDYHVPITYGIAPFVCPSGDTFCQHTMGTDDVFTVEDARTDPGSRASAGSTARSPRRGSTPRRRSTRPAATWSGGCA